MTPTLKTENYIIRSFKIGDLERFRNYRAIPSIAKYQSWSDFTYEDALNLFYRIDYSNFGVKGNWYQMAIAEIESNELIGDLALHFINKDQVEIGFTISPEYQGKGVAYESVTRILEYLFIELKKHRVVAITDAKNIASSKLLEKLGFRKEAHYVKNIFFKGEWGDEYQFAMLGSEFRSKI